MKLAGSNLNEVAYNMVQMKRWQPFKYAGTWFAAVIAGQGYAFKSANALKNKALKAGVIGHIEYAKIGGES